LSELGASKSVPLEPGSLFLSIAATVGKPIITNIKCCIHDGFVYFPQFVGNTDFLYYVFRSGTLWQGLGKVGTQLNLNTETVGSVRIPWPSASEQKQIVDSLDHDLKKLDRITDQIRREIDLVREYRTRLIADVVTGQLDVRVAAASLPDLEIEESNALLAEADRLVEDGHFTEEDEVLLLDEDDTAVLSVN
jgi:type I restriction enzyme, S subunit